MTRVEMHHPRTLAVATAVALVLAACNGDDGGEDPVTEDITGQSAEDEPNDPPDEEPDEVEDPTEPEDVDEPDDEPSEDENGSDDDGDADDDDDPDDFEVPDEIDEEYVQRVMDELMRRDSDLVAGILQREVPTSIEEEEVQQLDAIYAGPLLSQMTDSTLRLTSSEEARDSYRAPEEFGEMAFDVRRLHEVRDDCITALGWWDLTETAVNPHPPDSFIAMVLNGDVDTDEDFNPTGWRMWDSTALLSDGEPIQPDDWEGLPVGDIIDTECSEGE